MRSAPIGSWFRNFANAKARSIYKLTLASYVSPVQGPWVNNDSNGEETSPGQQSPLPSPPPPQQQQQQYYSPPQSSFPPRAPSHAAPRPRETGRKVVAAITVIVVIALGVVTYTLTRGGQAAASNSVTAQANANFNHVLSVLPKLGFAGSVPENAASDSSQNCSQTATGDVRQFLTKNPCKEYAVTLIKLRKQGIATQAVITWVVMGTSDLTARYKGLVDERYHGNPPGQPANFNGRCYASGRNGDSAWVAQVQPTGHVSADRQILGAIAPVRLTTSYLRAHCVG